MCLNVADLCFDGYNFSNLGERRENVSSEDKISQVGIAKQWWKIVLCIERAEF